jgi:hypothetical protein
MPDETTLKNSIKIFSSKYMADLSYDLDSSYVLNFNFITTFRSELKKVFDKLQPVLLQEPLEDISGFFTILPKGLKSVLSCLCRTSEPSFSATSQNDFSEFHVVANGYDPTSNDNFVGYYSGFCRIKEVPYSDLSDITEPIKFDFTGGFLMTALGAFDAFNVSGINTANQEIPFNYTPILFESKYAASVFKDDVLLVKGTDYSEDSAKVTVFSAIPTTSKITIVYIYDPQ